MITEEKVKVEKFKLTKDQVAFQKTYKQLSKVANYLKRQMDETAKKGASLGELMAQVSGRMDKLLQVAPKQPLNELVGQKQQREQPPAQQEQGMQQVA